MMAKPIKALKLHYPVIQFFIRLIRHRRETAKLTFRAMALRQSQSGDCELQQCYWWEHGNVKNKN